MEGNLSLDHEWLDSSLVASSEPRSRAEILSALLH